MIWLLAPLWLPALLLVLYCIGIQYQRGGWWWCLAPVAAAAWPLDILLAHTVFAAFMGDYPRRGEWTYSQHLGRLVTYPGRTGAIALYIARVLDAIAPSGKHIKPKT